MTQPTDPKAPDSAQDRPSQDILSMLRRQAEIRRDAVAIQSDGEQDITYQQLAENVDGLALRLQGEHRGRKGTRPRIGLVMPNGSAMATSLLSAAVAGTALPFNPSYQPAEFRSYFSDTSLDLLLVDGVGAHAAIEAAGTLSLPVLQLPDLKHQATGSAKLDPPKPDDSALVLMTSGSTGAPKAVPLTHRNLCHSTAEVCRSVGLTPDDICLCMWEQYHVGGLVDLLLAPLASGGMVYITPGFNAERFFELLDQVKPTWFQGVPTTLGELIQFAGNHGKSADDSSLRFIRSVAAALPADKKRQLESMFQVPVVRTFGMTEAAPLITSTKLIMADDKPNSVGSPCGCEVKILDANDNPLGPGREGRVFVRGENIFAGYENDPTANREHFLDDWFHTGDLGYLDQEGDLFLTGRTKQLINRGGEKINPVEVETALASHPSITDAAVFPIAHRTLGEEIAAAIVSKYPPSTGELQEYLKARLALFKFPKAIHVVEELPTNEIGKVDRRALSLRFSNADPSLSPQGTPDDDLESFLAVVWASELDVKAIGTLDDFSQLGGDSLATLRILVAVEKAFQSDLSRLLNKNLTTIRDFATALRQSGAVPEVIPDGRDVVKQSVADDSKPHADLAESYKRMAPLTNRSEAKVLGESMVSYATPRELKDLLDSSSIYFELTRGKGSRLAACFSRAFWMRMLWRWNIRRSLRRGDEHALTWKRTEISKNVLHYHSAARERNSKCLIVGFAGHSLRLMMPTYLLLCHLDPKRFDLLLLRDPGRTHYAKGIPGVCEDLSSLASFTAEFIRDHDYAQAVSLGTSAGGLASVCVAMENQWAHALAVGADDPLRRSEIRKRLQDLADTLESPTLVSIHYASKSERDRTAAESLHALVPGSTLRADPRFSTHVLLYQLYLRRELRGFLAKELVH